jgi:hypothetical protein
MYLGPFNFEKPVTKGALPKLQVNPYSWSKVISDFSSHEKEKIYLFMSFGFNCCKIDFFCFNFFLFNNFFILEFVIL